MENKPKTFIFVGRSGSGKGTQLELLKTFLSEKYKDTNIKSVVMGDIFRSFFKKDGYVQNIARNISMNKGKFQPDFITNSLFVEGALDVVDENSTLFFDGYPRNINQLGVIKELLAYIKRDDVIVLNIEVARDIVKERMLLRARGDDNENAIENRLNEYDKFIIPMIESLKLDTSLKYVEINGENSKDDVHDEIIKKINL